MEKIDGASQDLKAGRKDRNRIPNRETKDSVFRDLFSIPKYLLQLYQVLHPEDVNATESDLGNVTIQNVLIERLYNDLGFTVRDRMLMMVEAQSVWSLNISVRILLYLAETWNEYIVDTHQNPYGSKKLSLPSPEFYVIYIGEREEKPEWISLSEEFLKGNSSLELRVKVLYGDGQGNILDQYIAFAKMYDQEMRIHGRKRETVKDIIKQCIEKNILRDYLESREKEVIDIMTCIFDQEYLTRIYGEEKEEEGIKTGRSQGKQEAKKESALRMRERGYTDTVIADVLNVRISEVQEWLS